MKKSKVLIPAMALLVFSTAASISSTVAWFSATRVFKLNAGEFQVAQLDGNLECVVEGGVGTFKKAADGSIVVGVDAGGGAKHDAYANLLLDASYNAQAGFAGNAYRLDRDGNNIYESKEALDTKSYAAPGTWKDPTSMVDNKGTPADPSDDVTNNYYVAVSWTMTFKYEFASDTKDVGIFLDLRADQSVYESTAVLSGADAAKGMRIAFMTASNYKVWGNHVPLTSAPTAYESGSSVAADQVRIKDGVIYKSKTATKTTWDAAEWNPTYDVTMNSVAAWENKTYTAGDKVVYGGKVYSANENLSAESFTVAHWTEIKTADLRYVSGVNATSFYNANDYVYTRADGSEERLLDSTGTSDDTTMAGHTDYLGKLLYKDKDGFNKSSLVVKCVAWFEGEDPNVVNGTTIEAVAAKMKFYARSFSVTTA